MLGSGPIGSAPLGALPDMEVDVSQPSAEFLAIAQFGRKLKLLSLTRDGEYRFLDDVQNLHEILYVSQETLTLQTAVDELEALINDARTTEQALQDFFERHEEFILSEEYKKAHSHIVLAKDDGEFLIPDFVLEPVDQSSLADLLELKLPTAQVFVLQKRRTRFSAAVLEVCAQLREYSSFFDEEKNRNAVKSAYGLLLYRPKMFVIIGRRGDVSPIDQRKIEGDLPNLHLRTYDDVVNRMKNRVELMKKGKYKI